MKKILLFSAVLISFAGVAIAQQVPADSIVCRKKLSDSNEYFRLQNYSAAMESWRFVFTKCPSYSKLIYKRGASMFEKFIADEKNTVTKSKYIDTLMLIYDQEIKYFNEEGRVLGKKGISLYKFAPDRNNDTRKILERSVTLESARSTANVLQTYFEVTEDLYRDLKLNPETIIDIYLQVSGLIEINTENNAESYEAAGKYVDSIFVSVVSCKYLENRYTPLLDTSAEDVTLLKNVVLLLDKKQCYTTPLYKETSQKLHRTEPSGQSAINLAHMFIATGEYNKAAGYFNDAVELESNANKKSAILLEAASFQWRQLENYAQARTLIQRATTIRSGWGKPWIMLGDLYASRAAACNDSFKGASVYWVSTDKYLKAKSIDTNSASEADQKILINSKQYPNQKDILAKGMKVGDTYTVKCWINEVTIIRSQ